MKTIGYIRVSTEEQSLSVQAQRSRLQAYATACDFTFDEILVDRGFSAKTLARPSLQLILNDVAAGTVQRVVVLKLDRLTRSVRDLAVLIEKFQQHQTQLVSVSESLDTASAGGRLVMNMLATVAQWEREVISERTASVLAHKRATGRVYGKTPMGYRRDGDRLLPVPAELRVLRELRKRRAQGSSFHALAVWLNAKGVAPRHGGQKWHTASVQRVLRSKMAQAS